MTLRALAAAAALAALAAGVPASAQEPPPIEGGTEARAGPIASWCW